MKLQEAIQPRSLANGYGRRKVEKESVNRTGHKSQSGKTDLSRQTSAGVLAGSNSGDYGSPSRERLVYLTTCLIGHRVEVQVTDGSLCSGIYIIRQMLKKILGVAVTRDGFTSDVQHVKKEIMIDSSISQSRHVEIEFIFFTFRGWDQFEANAALFGVKSTFDEELYTTKLERGPQMRDLEREALKIAREIEGEETHDLHLAEERGIHPHENFDIDEETRFSSVFRGVDDSGYDEDEEVLFKSHNDETFCC
ncbi:hypothetical protein Vadar_014527 [Vaccinium darrowii]|uniref:Uncharacterized protein n=1 Tax=Vaccinium darrowii TaxID=229202 RepID=A0ACB7YDP5_9ERIC|nr:hypothetical protein Vadar_014527 [Vaccinium darrowii]